MTYTSCEYEVADGMVIAATWWKSLMARKGEKKERKRKEKMVEWKSDVKV